MTESDKNASGTLIIIGGHEDKDGKRLILHEVAKHLRGGKLVLATVASHEPEGYFETYQKAFGALGVTEMTELYVQERAETLLPEKQALFDGAAGVFFSGGDQLRITSQIGDTPLEARVHEIFAAGGVIAGTSAGASVMSETMLVRGSSSESHRIGDLHMAPGLGLIRDVMIDQHFGERGRIGRLLGAVAHNPRMLGIGIDENTAIVVHAGSFRVIGAGAVYVLDGAGVTYSNIADGGQNSALSLTDVRLHVLAHGDSFNLGTRRPNHAPDVESSHELELNQASDT
ncbi:cyanophycinase [Deinococcus sp. QL22]|uniref:cyanophycinase n=1 Tax=Deinococcus sp. QL22 TaxID=2939437 RepID=UPI002016BD0F|nr:cyanophycinase [Deinococcus sp. QL22]UQN09715.1 cyanophycinase [Deinococcus sp. QL22]